MRRAHNSGPRQQRILPMTITPQVAPMANQAFKTPYSIFFLTHSNDMGPHWHDKGRHGGNMGPGNVIKGFEEVTWGLVEVIWGLKVFEDVIIGM